MTQLQLRVIAALLLAPPALIAVRYLPPVQFAVLVCLLLGISAWEWPLLTRSATLQNRVFSVLITAAAFLAIYFLAQTLVPYIALVGLVWWVVATIWLGHFPFAQADSNTNRILKFFVGFLVLIPAGVSLTLIRSYDSGSLWVLSMLAIIWGTDIGAFVFGKAFGKRKLAPSISPGKTLAGFVGGVATGTAVGIIGAMLILPDLSWQSGILVSAAVAGFSVVGDLHISQLKRHASIKDTGNLIPGHGGALDRLDSLFAASPAFAFGLSTFLL